MTIKQTLFEKVWNDHVVVAETADTPAILYIDLHIVHEVTTPQAFSMLRNEGLPVRRPDLTLPTLDHSTPTTPVKSFDDLLVAGEGAANQVRQMEQNCADFGLDLLGYDSGSRGIVHVIGPELGATLPGKTIVCGDSHSSTHGAFGALAFRNRYHGSGPRTCNPMLAATKTQNAELWKSNGQLRRTRRCVPRIIILAVIGKIGVDGGTGSRYRVPRRCDYEALDMESNA